MHPVTINAVPRNATTADVPKANGSNRIKVANSSRRIPPIMVQTEPETPNDERSLPSPISIKL